jgi:hypothetical protein
MTMTDQERSGGDLLARLLGSDEEELSCEQCFEQLDRYVELELSGADADAAIPGMRSHFQGCSACAEDHRSLRALTESKIPSPQPPPAD